jgi:hypothetical protein
MVLPLTEQPGKVSVLTTVHPKLLGGYSPSELKISIQKKKGIVVKNPLIYARIFTQEVRPAPPTALFNAERIIKYSVIFSALTMPTN